MFVLFCLGQSTALPFRCEELSLSLSLPPRARAKHRRSSSLFAEQSVRVGISYSCCLSFALTSTSEAWFGLVWRGPPSISEVRPPT